LRYFRPQKAGKTGLRTTSEGWVSTYRLSHLAGQVPRAGSQLIGCLILRGRSNGRLSLNWLSQHRGQAQQDVNACSIHAFIQGEKEHFPSADRFSQSVTPVVESVAVWAQRQVILRLLATSFRNIHDVVEVNREDSSTGRISALVACFMQN
jgi:hypothetical protein